MRQRVRESLGHWTAMNTRSQHLLYFTLASMLVVGGVAFTCQPGVSETREIASMKCRLAVEHGTKICDELASTRETVCGTLPRGACENLHKMYDDTCTDEWTPTNSGPTPALPETSLIQSAAGFVIEPTSCSSSAGQPFLKACGAKFCDSDSGSTTSATLSQCETCFNEWCASHMFSSWCPGGAARSHCPPCKDPDEVEGEWEGYQVVSDCDDPALDGEAKKLFWSKTIARWDAAMELPFMRGATDKLDEKTQTTVSSTEKEGYQYDAVAKVWMKHDAPFESSQACMEWNDATISRFGQCGTYGGCNSCQFWHQGYVCPHDMDRRPAPCFGSFSKAVHWAYVQHHTHEHTVTASARWEQHESGGHNHSFYTVTVKGEMPDDAQCAMDFGVRLGTCKRDDCECTDGLIKYEVFSTDLSEAASCKQWYLSALTGVSGFFGLWRLDQLQKVVERCSPPTSAPTTAPSSAPTDPAVEATSCSSSAGHPFLEACGTKFCDSNSGSTTSATLSQCETCFDEWCGRYNGGSSWCPGKAARSNCIAEDFPKTNDSGDCPTGYSQISTETQCRAAAAYSVSHDLGITSGSGKSCQWDEAASSTNSNYRTTSDPAWGGRPRGCWQSSGSDGCVYWNPNANDLATWGSSRSICQPQGSEDIESTVEAAV